MLRLVWASALLAVHIVIVFSYICQGVSINDINIVQEPEHRLLCNEINTAKGLSLHGFKMNVSLVFFLKLCLFCRALS